MLCGEWRSYLAGCRCVPCRAAISAYKSAHRQQPTGTVDATPARTHLEYLSSLGLGTRQIASQAGVSARHVSRIIGRQLATIRPETARRLLAVRPVLAHGASVAGTKTHRYIDSLTREGFTRQQIAFHLGHPSQQLQLAKRVRVSSALRVAMIYSRLAGDEASSEAT